jgi:HK97 family phage major capsid protein
MNKNDIQDRLDAINVRLNEMVSACEQEQRHLNESEETEKASLLEERGRLNQQLNEINSQTFTPMKDEKTKFSLLQAIRSVVNGGHFSDACPEYAEEVRAIADKSGMGYTGQIQMKASAPERRSLDGILTAGNNFTANSHNGGLEMVREDVLPIIDALYNFTVLQAAGANFYNGLVGNAKIPTMSKINFGFKAENAAADNVTPTMGKAYLTPQRLTGYVYISKQLLAQTSQDIEANIRLQISKAIAEAFESAVLGYGSSPHNGIMNGATGVAEASLTYDTVLGLAEAVYTGNMRPTFIVNPGAARVLKQKARLPYGHFAIMSDGRVDDEPTFITNSLVAAASGTTGAIACADFSRLHVGTWGDLLDITVDPLTRAGYGEIVLTLNYYCDWAWDTTAYAVRKITAA